MAASVLLLSILLMIIVIPGVYSRTLPNDNNIGAVVGISLAIFFRLMILIWYFVLIKKDRHNVRKRKTSYITIGIILILLGLIYSDGAFAFLDNKNVLYISYLMFASVFCDFIASVLAFTSLFLNSKKID